MSASVPGRWQMRKPEWRGAPALTIRRPSSMRARSVTNRFTPASTRCQRAFLRYSNDSASAMRGHVLRGLRRTPKDTGWVTTR